MSGPQTLLTIVGLVPPPRARLVRDGPHRIAGQRGRAARLVRTNSTQAARTWPMQSIGWSALGYRSHSCTAVRRSGEEAQSNADVKGACPMPVMLLRAKVKAESVANVEAAGTTMFSAIHQAEPKASATPPARLPIARLPTARRLSSCWSWRMGPRTLSRPCPLLASIHR